MATNKFPPPPPQGMNMPYKNPMMQMNRGYNPHHNPMNQQQPMPFHPPPPPQQNTQNNQNQNQNQNQQGQYQQQQNIYDQYNYHRS